MLTTKNHSRDAAGMTYVYPVLSRRSGGLSVGINLNPDNACNWRCIYCQVPNLQRGSAPPVNIVQLASELRQMLDSVRDGSFYRQFGMARDLASIRDIAISGNGESTTALEFAQVVDRIASIHAEYQLYPDTRVVLITNGSMVHQPRVQAGLARLRVLDGEVWFKLDSVTRAGIQRINHAALSPARVRRNLTLCAGLCDTWIQSCFFKYHDLPPAEDEIQAYLDFVASLLDDSVDLKGVQLYGIERDSMQPEAAQLGKLDTGWFEVLARRLRALGLAVVVKV